MSQACPLTHFVLLSLYDKPTDQCFPFGSVPPGALGQKMAVHPPFDISHSAYTSTL